MAVLTDAVRFVAWVLEFDGEQQCACDALTVDRSRYMTAACSNDHATRVSKWCDGAAFVSRKS
jgi:hypothetical protein